MSKIREMLAAMTPEDAAQWVADNDISELMAEAEVVRERRPAKMVTALRIDLETQAALETAAAQRGIGSSTLMRQIIEEWVRDHRDDSEEDQAQALVYHLDAARAAAASLTRREAA